MPIRRIPRPLHLITVGSRCSQGISNRANPIRCGHVTIPSSLNVLSASRSRSGGGHSPSPVLPALFSCTPRPLRFRAVLRGLLERTNRQPPMVSYSLKSRTAGFRLIHRLGCPELFYLQHCKHCQRSLFARVAARSYFVPPKLGAGSHEGVLSP